MAALQAWGLPRGIPVVGLAPTEQVSALSEEAPLCHPNLPSRVGDGGEVQPSDPV